MKYVILFSLVFFNGIAHAKNYYFSTQNGDDTRSSLQAQNVATPWKTLVKLNSFFLNLQAGDSVLFKRGESFYGQILVTKSGVISLPIVFSAYGTGAKPIISGLTTLTGWTNLGNGLWESSSCPQAGSRVSILLVNGVAFAMGRYPNASAPNKGFLTYNSHSGNTSITDSKLPASPNWTGAELVIKKARWTFDRSPITNQTGPTLYYQAQTTYTPTDGFGYFIQNDIRTLDQMDEWYYNPKTKKVDIYYSSGQPPANIQVSTIDNLAFLNYSINNVTFDNLDFTGSNLDTFELGGQQNIIISNCDINFSGRDAIYGYSLLNFQITNSTINYVNTNAIHLEYNCNYTTIKNNKITNVGLNMGMADAIHYTTCTGISTDGTGTNRCKNSIIEGNTLDSIGYSGIAFGGDNSVVKNNTVSDFCSVKDDGGGIYTNRVNADTYVYSGIEIIGNIVLNGKVASEGTVDPTQTYTSGIYIDGDCAEGISILDNTVSNMPREGVFLHNTYNIILEANTLFNNSDQLYLSHDNISASALSNITNRNNIYFSRLSTQPTINFLTVGNDIKSYGAADSNYYVSPFGDNFVFHTKIAGDVNLGYKRVLSDWQGLSNSDVHSKATPILYKTYNAVLGSTIKNIVFNSNVIVANGITIQNGNLSWVKGVIDTGSIQVDASVSPLMQVNIPIGKVISGKDYILRFSSLAKINGAIQIYLSQSESNVDHGTANKNIEIKVNRTENEVVLHSTFSTNNESIVIKSYNFNSIFYLNNIQVYNATVSYINPDNDIRFEYNSTSSVKTVALDRTYIDSKKITYKGSVSLQPYSSIVLMAVGSKADKFRNNRPDNSTPVVY